MKEVGEQEGVQGMLADDHLDEDIKIIGRPNLQAATKQEPLGLNCAGALVLLQQQAAHEKTAQDEENVNARLPHEIARRLQSAKHGMANGRQSKVMRHHHKNGDPSDEI